VFHQIFHHRLAQDRNHRFGQILRQRSDPRALPGGKDHAFDLVQLTAPCDLACGDFTRMECKAYFKFRVG